MPMKDKSIKAADREFNVMEPSKERLLRVHLDEKARASVNHSWHDVPG